LLSIIFYLPLHNTAAIDIKNMKIFRTKERTTKLTWMLHDAQVR